MAQTVKKLSAMQETQVQSLGQEDAPEKRMIELEKEIDRVRKPSHFKMSQS